MSGALGHLSQPPAAAETGAVSGSAGLDPRLHLDDDRITRSMTGALAEDDRADRGDRPDGRFAGPRTAGTFPVSGAAAIPAKS